MAEEPQINCWEDFRAYVIRSDIRFVRPDYIRKLRREGRVFPRRQEAEGEEGALFQLDPATQAGDFKYVAVSHCWESREHPDPHGFQLALLDSWIFHDAKRTGNTHTDGSHPEDESQEVVFFIDYVSLYQFGNRTETQDASFRRSMEHMNLLYANSGADFCQGVLSISRLTPWWWKTDCGKAIPVFSKPAGRVQGVPLANLRPTIEGRCSEECDDSCREMHANSTPYWHRGWCRAEVEWASPAIQDISYFLEFNQYADFYLGLMWMVGLVLFCIIYTNKVVHILPKLWIFFGFLLVLSCMAQCGQCSRDVRANCAARRNPGTNGSWSRSRLALSAEEFQEQVRSEGLAFTHRSDVSQVVSLQEMVYKQKLVATKSLSLTRLARGDRRKLLGLLLENHALTELGLSATFFNEADIEALAGGLFAKELETLKLESVPLSSRSLRHLCSAFRPQLRVLALSWCGLGDHHMPMLAKSLGALPHVEELVLSYNRIGNSGAMILASALRSHPTLKCLDLSGNRLGHEGASALAEALMPNHAMDKLVLKGTWVRTSRLRCRPHQQIQLGYRDDGSAAHEDARKASAIIGSTFFGMWLYLLMALPYSMAWWAVLVIPPCALVTILCAFPSLLLWCGNCQGYMLEVSSRLVDWSLLFHDRLESSWATAGEVRESSGCREQSSSVESNWADTAPFLTRSCC